MARRSHLLPILAIALTQLLAIGIWFSVSAVLPQLTLEWELDGRAKSWMTMAVQLGFVAGALASALLNLADRVPARTLLAWSCFAGAAANGAIALWAEGTALTYPLRFLTGVTLAGIYPPSMKLAASWSRAARGLAIGLLVGALALGKALPHLLNGLAGSDGLPPWRQVLLMSSALTAGAGVLALLLVRQGPYVGQAVRFHWRHATRALAHTPTRLANFGYLGHMWELYAMWAWVPLFLLASFEAAGLDPRLGRIAGFAVIAAGGPGSVLAGILADRFGRTLVAGGSLAISGLCCLVAGAFFAHPWILVGVCVVWGFAVVSDSAQFSAAVSELSDPRYVGTALTVQTCLGFLLTLVTLRAVPSLAERWGWEWVFPVLVLGPIFGIVSMARLRAHPEATAMASGRR